MDDFAFDLDKALDELEATEDGHVAPTTTSTLSDQLSSWPAHLPAVLNPSAPAPDTRQYNYTDTNGFNPLYDVPPHPSHVHPTQSKAQYQKQDEYEPPIRFDLSEADFGPSITHTVTKKNKSHEVANDVGTTNGNASKIRGQHGPTNGNASKIRGQHGPSDDDYHRLIDKHLDSVDGVDTLLSSRKAVDETKLHHKKRKAVSQNEIKSAENFPDISDQLQTSLYEHGASGEIVTNGVALAKETQNTENFVSAQKMHVPTEHAEGSNSPPAPYSNVADVPSTNELKLTTSSGRTVISLSCDTSIKPEPTTLPLNSSVVSSAPADVDTTKSNISVEQELVNAVVNEQLAPDNPSDHVTMEDSAEPGMDDIDGFNNVENDIVSVQTGEQQETCNESDQTGEQQAKCNESDQTDEQQSKCNESDKDKTICSQTVGENSEHASEQSTIPDIKCPEEPNIALCDSASVEELNHVNCEIDSPPSETTIGATPMQTSTPQTEVVGFSDEIDLDISNDDLEKYLSTVGGPDNCTEYDSKPSFAEEMRFTAPLHRTPVYTEDGQTDNLQLYSQVNPDHLDVPENLDERRSSEDSLEKFLMPNIMSPGISTPMEDPGFSKVPGFAPDTIVPTVVSPIEEEAEESLVRELDQNAPVDASPNRPTNNTDSGVAANTIFQSGQNQHDIEAQHSNDIGGARPKETPVLQVKISRPSSLLGLSTPDLQLITQPYSPVMVPQAANIANSTTRDSGIIEDFQNSPIALSNDSVSENDKNIKDIDTLGDNAQDSTVTKNIHDVINMQLAAQKTTPLVKKQLNLAIKEKLNSEHQDLEDNRQQNMNLDKNIPVSPQSVQRPVTLGAVTDSLTEEHVLPPGEQNRHLQTSLDTNQQVAGLPAPSVDETKQMRPASLIIPPRDEVGFGSDASPSQGYSDDEDADSLDVNMGNTGAAAAQSPQEVLGRDSAMQPEIGAVGPITAPFPPEAVPPTSANINLAITQLGRVAPMWMPDAEAFACMQCEARFTFTKRRHHCRACGKVYCNSCCNLRSRIVHMENKEARVCSKCYQDLIRAQVYERMHQTLSPNPNNPSEYCSTLPPMQQATGAPIALPPTVMVPAVGPAGVLRKDGTQKRVEGPKQVMFSDGIRPGGDLTELDGTEQRIPPQRSGRRVRRVEKTEDNSSKAHVSRDQQKNVCLIPDQGLPPVLLSTGVKGDFSIEEKPDAEKIMPKIRSSEDPEPVVFAINKNLFVLVKIVNLDCCVNRVCWCFTTKGMCSVGQDEIVIVLECLPDEKTIPRDIFCHLNAVYEEASKGNTVSHLGHTIFAQGFLDCRDHSGFLYISATYQCMQKLILPPQPYIFGILLQKWETPWAKVFPMRLMLRLGAEYRYYPCPLISVRFRKPVFGEIGHTIMNLLADFRNYQYMLPQVPGVTVHMEDKQTYLNFPRNRYNDIMKVLTNSNDHVMALGANFSLKADSHLVCIQAEDGTYQTQAINIQNKTRKVTGASFVVFNGAFKHSSGLRAKSSIVEDGLMVQITAEAMVELKDAMKNMVDYTIGCGSLDAPQPEENVIVRWVEDDTYVNVGVKSPIDHRAMDGTPSIRIHTATDFVGDKHTIRWTEVFFIHTQTDGDSRSEPVDLSRLAESLAQATCVALTPMLDKLHEVHLTKIGLRSTIDPDKVSYEVGSNGSRLPDQYMDVLDNALIPVIHNAASHNRDGPVVLELVFHVIE